MVLAALHQKGQMGYLIFQILYQVFIFCFHGILPVEQTEVKWSEHLQDTSLFAGNNQLVSGPTSIPWKPLNTHVHPFISSYLSHVSHILSNYIPMKLCFSTTFPPVYCPRLQGHWSACGRATRQPKRRVACLGRRLRSNCQARRPETVDVMDMSMDDMYWQLCRFPKS